MQIVISARVFLMLLCCLGVNHGVLASPWDYAKVLSYKGCVKCHEKQVEVWQQTKHFHGFKKLSKTPEAKAIAKAMGIKPKRIKKDAVCANCHFTIGEKRGKPKPISGVSCESCHGPAKDWVKIHNNFGGKGVKRKFEAPHHKKQRLDKLDRLGMVYPGNYYGLAKNCLQCHIVANQKLVTDTKHAAGSDFNLVKRSQGKIRHGKPATNAQKRLLQIIDHAVTFELSIKALALAARDNRYTKKMRERSIRAYHNLVDIQQRVKLTTVDAFVNIAKSATFQPGDSQQTQIAKQFSTAVQRFAGQAAGTELSALDNRPLIILTTLSHKISATPAHLPVIPVVPLTSLPLASTITATATPTPTQPMAANPPTTPKPNITAFLTASTPLIKHFELITPLSQKLCQTDNPWLLGSSRIAQRNQPQNIQCVALHFQAAEALELWLLTQSDNTPPVRLLPNRCQALGLESNQMNANTTLDAPLDANRQRVAFLVEAGEHTEWFYAIAIKNTAAKAALEQHLGHINDICQDDTSPNQTISAIEFQAILRTLNEQTDGAIQWKEQHFSH